jgi:hypothetical protein
MLLATATTHTAMLFAGNRVISRKLLACSISEPNTCGYTKYRQVPQKHQD